MLVSHGVLTSPAVTSRWFQQSAYLCGVLSGKRVAMARHGKRGDNWPALRAGGLVLILLIAADQTRAQDAVQLCREKGTDDDVRSIPQSLVPVAKRIFGLSMPDQQVLHSTVFRCADKHVLLCTYGANLPCGKANSDRDPPGAKAWCHDHPNAGFVPRFAIPQGNIYNWGCVGGRPKVLTQIEEIDPRGFVARYWKPAD